MRNTNHTALATVGQIVWRLLELRGLDAKALFEAVGVDPEVLRDPGARLSATVWDDLVRRAVALTHDPSLGLDADRCWHPSHLGALGFAWLSSGTLRQGLQQVVRYSRLLGERAAVHFEPHPAGLEFVFNAGRSDPLASRVIADFTLSLLLGMCRMNAGEDFRPLQVCLEHPPPPDLLERYRSHYRCPVHVDRGRDSFLLAGADADRVLPSANRQIAATLDRVLIEQFAHLDRGDIVARAKASLLDRMSTGDLSEQDLAQTLHMSRRTLQRKLAEAETTYQQLVDDTRQELALAYIRDPRYSVTDITFMLGFSQQSAFTRAFRRWTGAAPSEYRQRHPAESD